jgi:hypothetical protein
MKVAIMQPYFFPYIGYFQLINAVDTFIFYDDVNFIKNGWINRNRILLSGESHYLTVQIKGASPNKLIKEVEFIDNRLKLLKTIEQAYKKALFYYSVLPVLYDCLTINTNKISELAQYSVIQTCKYLEIDKKFEQSSISYSNTKSLQKAERLQQICLLNQADNYYNPIGGKSIYNKQDFSDKNINLFFIEPQKFEYKQFNNAFIPWLSIIDVLMFVDKVTIKKNLNNYILV